MGPNIIFKAGREPSFIILLLGLEKSRQQRIIGCPMKRASNFTRISDKTTTRINKVREKQPRRLLPLPKKSIKPSKKRL